MIKWHKMHELMKTKWLLLTVPDFPDGSFDLLAVYVGITYVGIHKHILYVLLEIR